MATHTTKKAAACAAGSKPKTRFGRAWQSHRENPNDKGLRDALAREICGELRDYQALGSLFAGHEDDVLALASSLLVDSYLAGNAALHSATRRGDWVRVEEELRRSLKGALGTAKRRVGDQLIAWSKLEERLGKSGLYDSEPVHMHPCMRQRIWDLPVESQSLVVRDMLGEGAACKAISTKAARLVGTMIARHHTQVGAAKACGMSARAANSHVAKVRKYLRRKSDSVELAFL